MSENMSNPQTIMLIGASGFMGRHLSSMLRDRGFKVEDFSHSRLEITDSDAVMTAVKECNPDIVVNCAAISSTAYAKEHPDESMLINVTGPCNIASACHANGSGFYTMSSDQVYGGCTLSGPLSEDYDISPNTVYGLHKFLMEKEVMKIFPSTVLLRLTWMFEPYNEQYPHVDMVSRLVKAAKENATIKASTKEYRGITNVDTVCDNIIKSFGLLPGGVYNFGSGNSLDSYHTLLNVTSSKGYPSKMIVPDDSWGRNLSMDCSKIGKFGLSFPNTEESLIGVL